MHPYSPAPRASTHAIPGGFPLVCDARAPWKQADTLLAGMGPTMPLLSRRQRSEERNQFILPESTLVSLKIS